MSFCKNRMTGGRSRKGVLTFTESGTYDLRIYGLGVGDVIDIWVEGGAGGKGGSYIYNYGSATQYTIPGGIGGSGRTLTHLRITLTSTIIIVVIGTKGANGRSGHVTGSDSDNGTNGTATTITVNGTTYSASGGDCGLSAQNNSSGGCGGSGGSNGVQGADPQNGADGGNGRGCYEAINNGVAYAWFGYGQGTTTRPFSDTAYDPCDNFEDDGKAMIRWGEVT